MQLFQPNHMIKIKSIIVIIIMCKQLYRGKIMEQPHSFKSEILLAPVWMI